jgi:dihydroorotase
MKILLRSAKIIDPNSDHHLQTCDILIDEGRIESISPAGNATSDGVDKTIDLDALHVSTGWFDSFAHFADPGHEEREDLLTGLQAAASGGFTAVASLPNTEPVIDSKSQVEYLNAKARGNIVKLHPLGSVSKDSNGREMAELLDMHQSGAIAFTEGHHNMHHPGLMLRALRYIKAFESLIINLPQEEELVGVGEIHQSALSTELGFPGIPSLAENLIVDRDIQLLEYTDSKLHFACISSAQALERIKEAKSRSLNLTCGVAAYQLLFDESGVADFNSLYKVRPPLRSASDREALKQGILDGSIDLICSNHIPLHRDQKMLEFEYADLGMAAIETSFAAVCSAFGDALRDEEKLSTVVSALSSKARQVFGLPLSSIQQGENADLTLFDPFGEQKWERQQSRSQNNPMLGSTWQGKVYGIIRDDQMYINE